MENRKFKVGDRVRVTRDVSKCKAEFSGEEFTILHDEGISGGQQAWSGITRSPYLFKESELELVRGNPVRQVTRLEIVPGVYGHVHIEDNPDAGLMIGIVTNNYSAAELRDAADILLKVASAFEAA